MSQSNKTDAVKTGIIKGDDKLTEKVNEILAKAKAHTDASIAALLVKDVDNKTIKLNEGKAYVAEVSTDVLAQGEKELIFSAGNASGYTTTV